MIIQPSIFAHGNISNIKQMQWPSAVPILVLVLEPSTWMMLAVLAKRLTLLPVPEVLQCTVDMAIQRMLE